MHLFGFGGLVNNEGILVVVMGSLSIIAGVAVIWMVMQSRRHFREMAHRERLAMIERGLVPSPESNPQGFEQAMARMRPPESVNNSRMRSAGVVMIALGLALVFLISITAGEPAVGVGVGGAFAVLGLAFLVN